MDSTLPALHACVTRIQREKLESAVSVSLTCDGSKKGTDSVVAVVAHYIDPGWNLNRTVLGAIPNPTQQTGPEIAAIIQLCIDVTLAKRIFVAAVVTDGGSNYVRAGKLLGGDSFRCSARTSLGSDRS